MVEVDQVNACVRQSLSLVYQPNETYGWTNDSGHMEGFPTTWLDMRR